MADTLWGIIAGITDGHTFSIEITEQDKGNKIPYKTNEIVKASKYSIPDLPEDPSKVDPTSLLKATQNKKLKFDVQKTLEGGELLCIVSLEGSIKTVLDK